MERPEEKVECPSCAARFGHRSSLVRHLRRKCSQPQQQNLRRKACRQCVSCKTRCNLQRPSCSRCLMRRVSCRYPTPESEAQTDDNNQLSTALDVATASIPPALPEFPVERQSTDPGLLETLFTGFDSWDLLHTGATPAYSPCHTAPSDGAEILADNWVASSELLAARSPLLARPEPKLESPSTALAKHSMELIFRVMRTWPRMLADNFQTPPLFHPTQFADGKPLPKPLAHCFTLVKMWHGHCTGAEEMVRTNILTELDSLLDKFTHQDEPTLLAILQAVTIYSIVLLFLHPSSNPQPTMPYTNFFHRIQQLVYHVVSTGLFLQEEREQMKPAWPAWVHVTSKRRAVLSLYLLHWAYSVFHEIPSFNCQELGFMPAPAAKVLWQAETEEEWNGRYIHWLARWGGRGYLQGEFDKVRPGVIMETRAEKWLEEADEFGFIMISIVNATDFKPPTFGGVVVQGTGR